jgi:hypothetical protein
MLSVKLLNVVMRSAMAPLKMLLIKLQVFLTFKHTGSCLMFPGASQTECIYLRHKVGRHDTQHNDIYHNDIQH